MDLLTTIDACQVHMDVVSLDKPIYCVISYILLYFYKFIAQNIYKQIVIYTSTGKCV